MTLAQVAVVEAQKKGQSNTLAQLKLAEGSDLKTSIDTGIKFISALERLENKFDISFMYKTGLLDGVYAPKDIGQTDNLTYELQKLLDPYSLKYTRLNNRTFAISLDFSKYAVRLNAKMERVQGTVTDASTGETLPGVNVVFKGTAVGTATDADGNYSLDATSLQDTLLFSFIGYQTQEVPLNGRTDIDVALAPQALVGEDVVVVGYGSHREKADLTSAVAEVDMESVADRPVSNLTNLMQGQAPGLVAKQTSGTPGEELQVNIRGISSLGAGSEPLFVVDGFPVGTSAGKNIDPSNIESISVLKDASSTAIYGARGSNGVILITTKTAKEGDVDISFNATAGVQNLPHSRRTEMMNGVEFARFKKEAFMDKIRYFDNREPSIDEVPENYRHPENTQYSTNWLNQILNQNAPFSEV
ncbi:MAG: TonB-dependent receptor plug domain-containing protein [Balneolaceae bacterium]|nr:TonB-dependent receptor plug domain-containing protein [Balneolaceae bacterium]